MSNKNRERHGMAVAETESSNSTIEVPTPTMPTSAPVVNHTLIFKRNHPQNRASYGIPGVPGIVVIQRDLFAGTTVPASNFDLAGMPPTIEIPGAVLVSPKQDNKEAKAEAAAAKAIERAAKAAAKLEAQQAKARERQEKANAALAAAKAKLEAASKPTVDNPLQ